MPLSALFTTLLDLLSPPACIACNHLSEKLLCHGCESALRALLPSAPPQPFFPLSHDIHVFAAFHNIRPIDLPARLLKWMKYSANRHHADPIAAVFADFLLPALTAILQKYPREIFFLCPIPLHFLREHTRGFNHSMVLAQALSQKSGVPVCPALRRTVYTPSQTFLTRENRTKNMFNVFRLTDQNMAKNRSFILVDDFCTTGATLREAAKTLRTYGAQKVSGLVVGSVAYSPQTHSL